MTHGNRARRIAAFVLAGCVLLPATSFAQLKVITSGGFSAAFRNMVPEFERASGLTVTTGSGGSQGTGPNTIGAQLRRGVPADVVIMSKEGLEDLIADGRIVKGTELDLARTPLGMSVRAGAPKPKIDTVDAFVQTLLQAKSITFPASTTGIYMMSKLFPRLGIASQLTPKITNTGVAAVAKGEAELALQPVSELLNVSGTDFVGTLPDDVQFISVFSAAMVSGAAQPDAAKRLLAFLGSDAALAAIKKTGMEPLKR